MGYFKQKKATSLFMRVFWTIKLIIIIIIIIMRWAGHVARMDEGRGVHKVLVGKPEGKRPLGRPRRMWENNIKMDFQEVGRGLWGLDGVGSG
jgi:hypothetical protein